MGYLTGKEAIEAERWFAEAAEAARRASCLRDKCGAVIVKGGEVIGRGYNSPPLDKEENRMCNKAVVGRPKSDKTCCLHAEWRALTDALRNHGEELVGAALYFTRVDENGSIKRSGQPYCTVCSRLALDLGLAKFLLWHEEGITEYPTDEYNRLSYDYVP